MKQRKLTPFGKRKKGRKEGKEATYTPQTLGPERHTHFSQNIQNSALYDEKWINGVKTRILDNICREKGGKRGKGGEGGNVHSPNHWALKKHSFLPQYPKFSPQRWKMKKWWPKRLRDPLRKRPLFWVDGILDIRTEQTKSKA